MKIKIEKRSGIYQLESEQVISADLEKVWNFFSDPSNLDDITPDDMAFETTSKLQK